MLKIFKGSYILWRRGAVGVKSRDRAALLMKSNRCWSCVWVPLWACVCWVGEAGGLEIIP